MIRVEAVSKRYGPRLAVEAAAFTLRPGRITCLLGPSGCGKSTLLRLIAGLEAVDAGEIAFDGRTVSGPSVHAPPEDRDVGLVFQDYALFPHLTAAQNVAFGLRRRPAAERRRRVEAELERAGLADRGGAYPHQLSGGEQQRVALARALARDPKVVLLDEPFSGLDGLLKSGLRAALLKTLKAAGAATLIVTHDAEEAMLMADELILMRQGRILQTGAPAEVYLRPASPAAAAMLGEVSLLDAEADGRTARCAFGAVPSGLVGPVVIAARPEAFAPDDAGIEAEVLDARFASGGSVLSLKAGDALATARLAAAEPPAGDRIRMRLDPRFCAVFPA